ncbi:hypothetical protein Hanom_Chr06g00541291 [Helianthus anomalus]
MTSCRLPVLSFTVVFSSAQYPPPDMACVWWTRPRVKSSALAILWFGSESGLGELRQFLLLCIFVGFSCLFAPFAHLSSFDPVN